MPKPLYFYGENGGTHWIQGWACSRPSLDIVEKRKILHSRESKPGRPAHSLTQRFPNFYSLCPPPPLKSLMNFMPPSTQINSMYWLHSAVSSVGFWFLYFQLLHSIIYVCVVYQKKKEASNEIRQWWRSTSTQNPGIYH
jgi:hypothetical protein